MSVENPKDALPEYAKDVKLNLGSITRTRCSTKSSYGEPYWPAPRRHGTPRCCWKLATKQLCCVALR